MLTLPTYVYREQVLLDYLQIENPVVFNHLVDQKSIESVIVCRTQDSAKALMTRREYVPANVSYAITHDFYRFFPPRETSSYRLVTTIYHVCHCFYFSPHSLQVVLHGASARVGHAAGHDE